eukprot:4402920-Lingulodinium_polyedra.AAC.1
MRPFWRGVWPVVGRQLGTRLNQIVPRLMKTWAPTSRRALVSRGSGQVEWLQAIADEMEEFQ